jgi:hypothetical protein
MEKPYEDGDSLEGGNTTFDSNNRMRAQSALGGPRLPTAVNGQARI